MKESISYTFLLNIIITFVFVCFAIIMGIFSYYRAFKANNIIINEIEKYEGYNCLSKESIARKLPSVSYNLPFKAECDENEKRCVADENNNYLVVSYNIDYDLGNYVNSDKMDSNYSCTYKVENGEMITEGNVGRNSCQNTKQYQYGVYTYMYVDLPVISGLLKLKLFSKTSILYDYREIARAVSSEDTEEERLFAPVYDIRMVSDSVMKENLVKQNDYAANKSMAYDIQKMYRELSVDASLYNNNFNNSAESNARLLYQYDITGSDNATDGVIDANDATFSLSGYKYSCGFVRNYSLYRR